MVSVEDQRPVGILTERDVLRVYAGRQGERPPSLSEAMASPVPSVDIGTTIKQAAGMLESGVRYPVVGPEWELAADTTPHGPPDPEYSDFDRPVLHTDLPNRK